jgi:hypothetical protein
VSALKRRVVAIAIAFAACAAAARVLAAQQDVPADRVRIADAVRADLAKLSDLERAHFTIEKRYTADIKSLNFSPTSGATISITYASARAFSASASHPRLAPFLCFVIVSSTGASTPAEKPFCTDSRYVTAATALARAGSDLDSARVNATQPVVPSPEKQNVMPITVMPAPEPLPITPSEFAERLKTATDANGDSVIVVVQFAVKDARYDPSRGVLEVAVERVPLPLAARPAAGGGVAKLALACFTRPAARATCQRTGCGGPALRTLAPGALRDRPARRHPRAHTDTAGPVLALQG